MKDAHESHALQVWPKNGHFLILSGHHRFEAAKRKDLTALPCWVRDDLDEEGAYMLLATDNTQGELSPLEIGVWVLGNVDKGSGGRGKKGGLIRVCKDTGKKQG